MALSEDGYKAMEDIVGPEYISKDPVILDSYTSNFLWQPLFDPEYLPKPEAVVLPASTEEIQALVKACNKYGVRFHAFGTGWMVLVGENRIQMDLKRMNRIICRLPE